MSRSDIVPDLGVPYHLVDLPFVNFEFRGGDSIALKKGLKKGPKKGPKENLEQAYA